MAENLSPLELVPRGVEGTGKAVVLGNEPVVQSLARLSSRMDNLERLKLYAQAKKAAAKQEKPDYDKTPIGIPTIEGGVLGKWNAENIQDEYGNLAKNWLTYNPEVKQVKLSESALSAANTNQYVKDINDRLPKEQEGLLKMGYIPTQEDLSNAENQFLSAANAAAEKAARDNNITDPQQVKRLRNKYITNNDFVTFYSNSIMNNPDRIDLNSLGGRIEESMAKTSRFVNKDDGTSQEITYSNIKNPDGSLNKNEIKLAIKANPIEEKMFNLSTRKLLTYAAPTIGEDAAKITNKFMAGEKLSDDEQKVMSESVIPKAQDMVLSKMFAGKGLYESKNDYETTKDKAKAEAEAQYEAGETGGTGSYTIDITAGAVKPVSTGGVTDLYDNRGKQLVVNLGRIPLGKSANKTLKPNDYFEFAPGSKAFLTGNMPIELREFFGKAAADGSYSTNQSIKSRSAVLLLDDLYATANTAKTPTGNYIPKGTVVKAKTYGSTNRGKNYMVVSVDDFYKDNKDLMQDFIKAYPPKKQKELYEALRENRGARIIISTEDNTPALSKFYGEKMPRERKKSNASTKYFK